MELRMFDKILTVRNGNRYFSHELRANIIDRLILILSKQTIEFNQELKDGTPSDTEV